MIAAKIANLTNRDNQYTRVGAAAAAPSISQPEAAKLLDCQLRQRAARLAETIWRLGADKTQQAVADELGWTREKICAVRPAAEDR